MMVLTLETIDLCGKFLFETLVDPGIGRIVGNVVGPGQHNLQLLNLDLVHCSGRLVGLELQRLIDFIDQIWIFPD